MSAPIQDSLLCLVEYEIAHRFRFLRFQPPLEKQFEIDTSADRCRQMIKTNYLCLVIYHLFLFSDYRLIGDVFGWDLFSHFAIMTPFTLIASIILARHPPAWLREGSVSLGAGILTLTIVSIGSASEMPTRDIVLSAVALVVLFVTVLQRLRFRYAMGVSVIAQILYAVGVAEILPRSTDRMVGSIAIMLGILVFSLIGCYNLEHENRMGYLLRVRDRIRNRELEALGLRDPLTGIGNRRALDASLARRPTWDTTPGCTAVLILDVDHFKAFNDTNGHQAGDICLTRIARLVTKVLSCTGGEAYRFGGEEFVVVLDEASLERAVAVADSICSTIAGDAIPRDMTARTFVTVSIGVAAGRLGAGATSASLIAAADSALYAAKLNGRNQVWPPSQTEEQPDLQVA